MKIKTGVLLIGIGVCLSVPAMGTMWIANEWTADLTHEAEAKATLTWAQPEKIGVTKDGLGWDGDPSASVDGWIETQPIAVGTSWRPAPNVRLEVKISPAPKPFPTAYGQMSTFGIGAAYARYSPDGKHWSTWQALSPDSEKYSLRTFKGYLEVPKRERVSYEDLLSKYSALDVRWKSDEEAAVRWILKRQPDFFAHSLPFIGYVQVLYEVQFGGGDRIHDFKVHWDCAIGSMATTPKDLDFDIQKDRGVPWRFTAP
ncbi:MAG: hypothetical protein ACFUZC_18250 [Chthoniobacteraceae bacterium]